MPRLNPAGAEIGAIEFAGEIAVPSEELFPAPDGFFEGEIFEAMEGIVMHEVPHRPILGDNLACEADHAPELHAFGFNIDGLIYRFHETDSIVALVPVDGGAPTNRLVGARPRANTIATTSTSDANSDWCTSS